MTLDEAIRVLCLEGYPSSVKVARLESALPAETDNAEKVAALTVVKNFLTMIHRESAALREAHKLIEWGPGSTTEYQEWESLFAQFGALEEEEAKRRGAPKGPKMHLGKATR